MNTKKTVMVAAKLYEIRETVRAICGADYARQMKQFGAMIQAIAREENKDILAVAKERAQMAIDAGDRSAMAKILAAAVELIEPSEVKA